MLTLLLSLLLVPVFGQENEPDKAATDHSLTPLTTRSKTDKQQNIILNRLQYGRYKTNAIPTYLNGFTCANTSGKCITFNDGTTQDTAPGNGNVTFITASTVTVLGYNNWEIMIASHDFSNVIADTATITSYAGFTSTTTYRWKWDVQNIGATSAGGGLFVQMNGAVTNYATGSGECYNGAAANALTNRTNNIPTMENANTLAIGDTMSGDFTFKTFYGAQKGIWLMWRTVNTSNTIDQCFGGSKWTGSATPTSITIEASAVNERINGHWELWQSQSSQP